MTALGDELKGLSAEERELLEILLREQGVDVESSLILPRPAEAGLLPLTPAQRRFWLLDRVARSRGLRDPNVNPVAWRIRGGFRPGAFEAALNELMRRHEVLRTTVRLLDEQPVQVVDERAGVHPAFVDLKGLSASDREAAVGRSLAVQAETGFDLQQGPLIRATVLELAEDEHVLALATHYMVADGVSEGLLLRELGELYDAFTGAEPPRPARAPIQYGDFALWQQGWLDRLRETQLAFWKDELRGSPPELALPTDRPRPPFASFSGGTISFQLPADLTAGLRQMARTEGVTLYMFLLAALQALLHRYSGQEDVVVGTTVSDRPRAETEALLGSFSNNLLVRTRFDTGLTFRALLGVVGTNAARGYAHQNVPFEEVVEALYLDPEIGDAPQLQVVFVYHDRAADDNISLRGLSVERLPLEKGTATFDLYFRISDQGERLNGSIEYSTDLFDEATIAQIATDFERLLGAVAGEAEIPVASLPLSDLRARRSTPEPAPAFARPAESPGGDGALGTIAAAWTAVLGRPVGFDDSFFDLGGSSRHLLLVGRRLEAAFGRPIPVISLFEHPTVRSFARYISGEPEAGSPAAATKATDRLAARARRAQVRQDRLGSAGRSDGF